eukprot:m.62207 g.62207  ORF g.62207 m.62207 type:complete len:197 (-) comp19345_c0_seq1:304-894(-)
MNSLFAPPRPSEGPSNPTAFFLHPASILRFLEILCAIIVFGALAANGSSRGHSVYNDKDEPLHFAIGVGVSAFLVALGLLIARGVTELHPPSAPHHKKVVITGLALSAFWAFLWFVAFCWLANQWSKTKGKGDFNKKYVNAAQSAIAFSFFSVIFWGGSVFYGVLGVLNKGSDTNENYAGSADPNTAYAAFEEPKE